MAVVAITLVGCKDKNTPEEQGGGQEQGGGGSGGGGGQTVDIPDGYVQILIQVPDGDECQGIYMKGNINGSDWSGSNTYIGEAGGDSDVDKAIKFKRIAEGSDFFSALFKLGSNGLEGAVCQRIEDDGSWQGKSRKVKLIADKTTLPDADKLELPQFHIPAGTKPATLALKIGGWEQSPCVTPNPAGKAIWIMKSKVALPEGTQVGITGENIEGYSNWQHEKPIIMTKQSDGSYMAMCNVKENCVYKYVLCFSDEAGFDDKHGHVIDGDHGNLVMPNNLEPVDEVDEWLEFDKHYVPEPLDKTKTTFSLIGDAVGGWDKDVDLTYGPDEESGKVYVAEAANVDLAVGGFKVRTNKDWDQPNFGYNDVEIDGDSENFEADKDGNLSCKVATKYSKITFKFKWNGSKAVERKLIFTK